MAIAITLLKAFTSLLLLCFTEESTNQSPIDLVNDLSLYTYLSTVYITSTSYRNLTNPIIYVFNNGEKFATNDLTLGSMTVSCNGRDYEYTANELRFFSPSEHAFEAQNAQIEMQIHHTLSSSSNDPLIQSKLILSVFFLGYESHTNEFIRSFINFRDENSDDDLFHTIDETLPLMKVTNHSYSDLNKLVRINKMFFFYEGSQTIAPYEEKVSWMILNYFYYLSDRQFKQIEKMITKYKPNGNNRELQTNANPVYLLYNNSIKINMVFNGSWTNHLNILIIIPLLIIVFSL